jgi:hypothetical protein
MRTMGGCRVVSVNQEELFFFSGCLLCFKCQLLKFQSVFIKQRGDFYIGDQTQPSNGSWNSVLRQRFVQFNQVLHMDRKAQILPLGNPGIDSH